LNDHIADSTHSNGEEKFLIDNTQQALMLYSNIFNFDGGVIHTLNYNNLYLVVLVDMVHRHMSNTHSNLLLKALKEYRNPCTHKNTGMHLPA